MEARLTTYQTELTPQLNARVDNLEDYLNIYAKSIVETTIQYQKLENTELAIKIDADQTAIPNASLGNYAALDQDGAGRVFYYFIIDYTWKSAHCVELTLSLDSVNTFADVTTFSPKTTIVRQHKDRWVEGNKFFEGQTLKLVGRVDKVDEGIGGVKQELATSTTFADDDTSLKLAQNFYLIYKSHEAANTDDNVPIDIYLCGDNKIKFAPASGALKITYDMLPDRDSTTGNFTYFVVNPSSAAPYFTVAGSNYTIQPQSYSSVWPMFVFYREGSNIYFKRYRIGKDGSYLSTELTLKDSYIVLNGTVTCSYGPDTALSPESNSSLIYSYSTYVVNFPAKKEFSSGTDNAYECGAIADLDRTDPQLVKIIKLPYAPTNFKMTSGELVIPSGWEPSFVDGYHFLKLTDYTTEFLNKFKDDAPLPGLYHLISTSKTKTLSIFQHLSANPTLDPKIYNSAFSTFKLLYDSYSTTIPYEQCDFYNATEIPTMSLYFKPSNTISSNCGFKWVLNSAQYSPVGDYDNFLISTRNNELPIYTNDYLDYIRNGYNYDRKAATQTEAFTWIGTGISIAGAAVSLAAAIPTKGLSLVAAASMGAGAVNSIAGAINTTITAEDNLAHKLEQSRNQAAAVSGADDVDLLQWYGDNKLRGCLYQPSMEMRRLLGELFYYCGYANGQQGVPDIESRLWFNYIQCNAVFDESANPNKLMMVFQDDLKARYSSGVTVFHEVNGQYDLGQRYENWETSLF